MNDTMSNDLKLAIINSAINLGISATITLIEGIKAAKTIDDAIAALKAAEEKTWKDYKDEASKS